VRITIYFTDFPPVHSFCVLFQFFFFGIIGPAITDCGSSDRPRVQRPVLLKGGFAQPTSEPQPLLRPPGVDGISSGGTNAWKLGLSQVWTCSWFCVIFNLEMGVWRGGSLGFYAFVNSLIFFAEVFFRSRDDRSEPTGSRVSKPRAAVSRTSVGGEETVWFD